MSLIHRHLPLPKPIRTPHRFLLVKFGAEATFADDQHPMSLNDSFDPASIHCNSTRFERALRKCVVIPKMASQRREARWRLAGGSAVLQTIDAE
jgi:hypothetical protein